MGNSDRVQILLELLRVTTIDTRKDDNGEVRCYHTSVLNFDEQQVVKEELFRLCGLD